MMLEDGKAKSILIEKLSLRIVLTAVSEIGG